MSRQLSVIDPRAEHRSCGTCNMCCTTHGVEEIKKLRLVKCKHLTTLGRCGCYATRPDSCRTYECMWLSGHLPKELKPNVVRAVIDPNGDQTMLIVHILPQDRGAHRRGHLRDFITRISKTLPVIVVCGDERAIIGARQEDVRVIGVNIGADGQVVQEVINKDLR